MLSVAIRLPGTGGGVFDFRLSGGLDGGTLAACSPRPDGVGRLVPAPANEGPGAPALPSQY